ncbi:MAG TPA: hypothetical protein VM869_01240 [Enhygromyxa sp.]|nr:hypothetical protein [Enhygromyxa sp.]
MTALVPVPEPADGMFPQLLVGIREFRARVEGTDASEGHHRTRMLALAGETGLIPDIVRYVLGALHDVLAFIHDAVDNIDRFLGPADAMLALIETLGQGLAALGTALSSEAPDALTSKLEPVTDGLVAVGQVLADVGDIELPNIIPTPSTLAAIRVEIVALLGQDVDPEAESEVGSLGDLIAALT